MWAWREAQGSMMIENAKEVKQPAQPHKVQNRKEVALSSRYTLRSNRVVAVTYGSGTGEG